MSSHDDMISRGVSNNIACGNNVVRSFQSRVNECVELQHNTIPPVMLTCTKCGETKPEDAFNKNRSRKTGRQAWCRECTTENDRNYAHTNKQLNLIKDHYPLHTLENNVTALSQVSTIIANDLSTHLHKTSSEVVEMALKHYMVYVYRDDV